MSKYLKVQLNYSAIARDQRQKHTLRGLGLRHRHQIRILKDSPAVRGLIQKVIHLISFEETDQASLPKKEKVKTYQLGEVKAPAKAKSVKKPAGPTEAKAPKKDAEKKKPATKAPKKTSKAAKAPKKS